MCLKSHQNTLYVICTSASALIIMLSLPATVETRQRIPVSPTTPTQPRSTRWPCHCSSYCCACVLGQEQRQSNGPYSIYAAAAELRATKMPLKNVSKKRRKPGIWCHTSTSSCTKNIYVAGTYLASVRETANSSAWNHIFKFQQRGPPRRRARNCCRFAILTKVHQGAHICLAK